MFGSLSIAIFAWRAVACRFDLWHNVFMAAAPAWEEQLSQGQRDALERVRTALFVPAEERSHFERQGPSGPGEGLSGHGTESDSSNS